MADQFAWVYKHPKWYRLCTQVYDETEPRLCYFCGQYVDYAVPARTSLSKSVHHIIDLADGGEPFDPENVALAHYGCNSRAGAARQAERDRPVREHKRAARAQGMWMSAPKGSI